MTREETAKLLAMLFGAYPHVKVKDASATVASWELVLGHYSAESVYKAARLHISSSPYFPSPSDILDKIVRAEIVFGNTLSQPAIEAPKAKVTPISEEVKEEYLDAFCEMMGFGYEEDETHMKKLIDEHPELRGILPYEM